ncbi:MAG: hypothetical protein HeimC3_13850 [Candidatus Heimdallarchaeota archaeon LC_3]|nr:MAG: hypothetical protein HeimC3_13850 [Candidatus Heimdallarchaeota archaeon LC_3]
MKVVYQSIKLDTLCNLCNIPLNNTIDPSILYSYIKTVNEQLKETVDQTANENIKIMEELQNGFHRYQPQILNQEQFLRQKHRELYTKTVGTKNLSLKTQLKIRSYHKEVNKLIDQYENTFLPLHEKHTSNQTLLSLNNKTLKDMKHFTELIHLISELEDFEGRVILFDWFLLILSTSGLHLVYNMLPDHMTEDLFRNYLYKTTLEYFNIYFGKKTDVIIELYNLEQYKALNYEQLPDKLNDDELMLFTNILESNNIEITI